MKRLTVLMCSALALAAWAGQQPDVAARQQGGDKGFVELFNGKDLTGWKWHPDSPGKWEVKDGCIVGSGEKASHLFTDRGDYQNFDYIIEAKISDKGNSGQYFRAKFAKGYPPGYEAQINSTHSDYIRTGSLYPNVFKKLTKDEKDKLIVTDQLHKPDEWFTQEVIAKGNHIRILVNGKQTVDFIDNNNTYTKGHLAIQGHDAFKDKATGKFIPTIITVRKVAVKELPPTAK
jgi:hypothetical protein